MIKWKVESTSTWTKVEVGYLKDLRIASIETIYDHQRNRTIRTVIVRFFIDSLTLTLDAPNWYVDPDMSCEIYRYKIKKHHELKKRFDNFMQGDYTECYEWVQVHLDTFLQRTGLRYEVQGQDEGC